MPVDQLFILVVSLFGLGCVAAFFTQGNPKVTNYISHGLAACGCLATVGLAVAVFLTGDQSLSFAWGEPIGSIKIRLDGLASFFLLTFGVVGTATSVYAIGYCREFFSRRLAQLTVLYNAFLLSIVLVLTVSQVMPFIIVWELMSVVSFFLVNHEYEKDGTTSAAYLYILMTHVGTVFIASAFLLLAVAAGSGDFELLGAGVMSETLRSIVFLCALLGFGTKAGVIPMHIWLPEAHPAAPSHVSALMSGIMLKTAIYGMCRFFLEFLGSGPEWWGQLVLVLAIISSVFGVLYALMEQDIKRLLAYSSVENIGIILLGMGAGMLFMSKGMPLLAGIAWVAALCHVFNHAVFKSLLFMGAGAVLQATHTKNMEHLGGLIKKMPYTAVCFLIGATAISGLPPLNGFVSEWLTFQALFFLPKAVVGIVGKIGAAMLIALLGLTGALAGACFVKAFGVTFLAKPRSKQSELARETSRPMIVGMGGLAVVCIAAGVWPHWLLEILQRVLPRSANVSTAGLFDSSQWYAVAFQTQQASGVLSMPMVVALVGIGLVVAYAFARAGGSPRHETGETWTCGIIPTARMEYTSTGFAEPVRRAFRSVLNPVNEVRYDRSASAYHGVKISVHVHVTHYVNELLYKPFCEAVFVFANYCKLIQAGSLQLYIGYIMAITVIVMIIGTGW
ncbi:MAG TPA: proton-conducting transporter membrane subunit [Patescibacteria group bacterium]|nr:proton-conducting transporter membrane subunit [Patescibacteria group bacterium]